MFEELNTLVMRVEAILNSRPLTSYPHIHPYFLIDNSLNALPGRDLSDIPIS